MCKNTIVKYKYHYRLPVTLGLRFDPCLAPLNDDVLQCLISNQIFSTYEDNQIIQISL